MPNKNSIQPLPFDLDNKVFEKLPDLVYKEFNNGLRAVFLPNSQSRSFSAKILLNAGAIHQNPTKRGLAHFVEHLMFRSTEKFKDKEELTQYEQDFNLSYNGYTSDTEQSYYVSSDLDEEATNAAANFLSQIVLHPKLEEKYIEIEKQIVLAEKEAGDSQPSQVVWDAFANHFYDNAHPLSGGSVIGEKEAIAAYTHADVLEFHSKYFTPANMILVMSGGVNLERMQVLAEKYFVTKAQGTWQQNPFTQRGRIFVETDTNWQREFNHIDTSLGFYFSWQDIPLFSKEQYAIKIIEHAISTRIFLDLREKQGLAYYVGFNHMNMLHGRFIYMNAEFSKKNYVKGRKYLEEYMQNLGSLSLSEAEFKRAMRKLKSTRWADNVHSIASFAASNLFNYGSLTSPEYTHETLQSVTLDFVNNLMPKLFENRKLESIVVGPIQE